VSPFLHVLNEMVDQKDMDERVKKAEAARETRTLKKAVVLAGVVGATGALLLLSVRWLLGPEGTRRESVKPRSAKTRADEEVVRRLLTADEIHIDAERGLIDSAALPEVSRWNADVRSARAGTHRLCRPARSQPLERRCQKRHPHSRGAVKARRGVSRMEGPSDDVAVAGAGAVARCGRQRIPQGLVREMADKVPARRLSSR